MASSMSGNRIHESTGVSGAYDSSREEAYCRPRILTVDEALPYSPFSSILPFNSDIIPLPTIGIRSSPSIFSTQSELEDGRYGLERLNLDAENPTSTSERLYQTLHHLKELLNPGETTQFKFKTGPRFNCSSGPGEEPRLSLSTFSKIVLENTSIGFTYPSPEGISRAKRSFGLKPKSPSLSRLNQRAFQQNSLHGTQTIVDPSQLIVPIKPVEKPPKPKPNTSIEVSKPSPSLSRSDYVAQPSAATSDTRKVLADIGHRQQSTPISHVQACTGNFGGQSHADDSIAHAPEIPTPQTARPSQKIKAEIPNVSADFRGQNNEANADVPNTSSHLSKKPNQSGIDAYEEDLVRGSDQREKADGILRGLQEYLQDIFEAEDRFDTIAQNQLFTATRDGGLSLNVNTLTKLHYHLQRTIHYGRFSKVDVDDLLRVQRLCEGALKDAETADLNVKKEMSGLDFEVWLSQLTAAELGLKSARTSLRIMTGSRDERQLYSEDVTQSALNALRNILEICIIPIFEMRSSGPSSALFKLIVSEKNAVIRVLNECQRLLSLLAKMVAEIDLSDTVITTLETMAFDVFFVENASSEKESILGVSKFDGLRTAAMEVLLGFVAKNPLQSQSILDAFLTSLGRLPVTKHGARQFKLPDGSNMQHASALIMRLVQSNAIKADETKEMRMNRTLRTISDGQPCEPVIKEEIAGQCYTVRSEIEALREPSRAASELRRVACVLIDPAKKSAVSFINWIVDRATITKGSESPYRLLLDFFLQDFLNCLDSPDWPAAELLLRVLLYKMIEITKTAKSSYTAKTIALELLGQMGPKISQLHWNARKMARSVEHGQNELSDYLARIVEQFFENKTQDADKRTAESNLLSFHGPFSACLEFLQNRLSEDMTLGAAIAFTKVVWATRLLESFAMLEDDQKAIKMEYGRSAWKLREMIVDSQSLTREHTFSQSTPAEVRLANILIVITSPFCQQLDHILLIFLQSLSTGQATVQAKSLKCLFSLLDTDPGIIDRYNWVKDTIVARLDDVSSSVRDQALTLISKMILLRPKLESDMIDEILGCLHDPNTSVRKRAIKIAQDVYKGSHSNDVRSKISRKILWKTTDDEVTVQELSRQTLEELWFAPFYKSESLQFKLKTADLVSLMIESVRDVRTKSVDRVVVDKLDKLLKFILAHESKNHADNYRVCKVLVDSMFETVIDNSSGGSDSSSRSGSLYILDIFAKSNPTLFTVEHIKLLHPYIAHLGDTETKTYGLVVNIFKNTLSHLPSIKDDLLKTIRDDLLRTLTRMPPSIVDDMVACISNISKAVNDIKNLTALVSSGLATILDLRSRNLDEKIIGKFLRLLPIVGLCGKHCNFESQRIELSKRFPQLKDDETKSKLPVSKLITDTIVPLASNKFPLNLRKTALQAVGFVCSDWPQTFGYANIYTTFEAVFDEKQPELETVILEAFKVFLDQEEKQGNSDELTSTASSGKAKLGIMGGNDRDGVANAITTRFLDRIIAVALRSEEEAKVFLATEIISSIARQDLEHPKKTGVALINLGTSEFIRVADVASEGFNKLYTKYETKFETEFVTAVQSTYEYQRNVTKDTRGAKLGGTDCGIYFSKLHRMLKVMNDLSKPNTRKKFYEKMCLQLDHRNPRKDLWGEEDHIKFSQFVAENLAFFEYQTVDELLCTLNAMEKIVSSVGTGIAHAFEQEILHINVDHQPVADDKEHIQIIFTEAETLRLEQLTRSSMTLSLIWEARTYLRRQYNLVPNKRDGKGKIAKDMKLTKAPFVNGDKFWEDSNAVMKSLASKETMMAQCRKFVENLNIDQDFKIEDEDEDIDCTSMTPEGDDADSVPDTPRVPGSGRSRKRKANAAPGSPNSRKKRGRPKFLGKRLSASVERSDEDGGDYL